VSVIVNQNGGRSFDPVNGVVPLDGQVGVVICE
jgi:hypothetical protein